MKIKLIAIGKKMPVWVETAYNDYAKRLKQDVTLELIALDSKLSSKQNSVENIQKLESQQLLAASNPKDRIVVLDKVGKAWNTEGLSRRMADWQQSGGNVSLIVGGPEGIHPDCLAHADEVWSLSPLTFPHPLVRVIVAEQIYRAWSILHNHPYHRS